MNESSELDLSAGPRAGAGSRRIRVVVADDHPVILAGARQALAQFAEMEVVGQARHSTELVNSLAGAPCDALVTDLAMPGGRHGDGLPLIGYVQRHFAQVAIVVLTMLENAALIRRLGEMGVTAIVSKSDDLAHIGLAVRYAVRGLSYASPSVRALRESVRSVGGAREGEVPLSPREIEVVRLFVSGMTVKEIAERLNRSIKTVSCQKVAALRKLGLERDAELYEYAQGTGLMNVARAPGQ
jgi:two-component system capsular synthesis response regulator RcsB